MNRALDIWWDGRIAGRLATDEHGVPVFAYSEEWLARPAAEAPPLSASLPRRAEPFSPGECRPFFAGLLPDEGQRRAVARALGVSDRNDFALLDRLGGEVAGALQLLPPGEAPPPPAPERPPEPLGEAGLVRLLDGLPARPMLAGQGGLRLSLAGAQSKLPVVLAGGEVAAPAPDRPTTHILKPPIPDLPGATANEAFAMRLAAAVGLDVAPVEPRAAGGRPFLLVERYDRRAGAEGWVRRLHQEDFCQALGVSPERKYATQGGPGFRACFELLRRVSARPAEDALKLLDAAIFNLAIGNADAHGKNFSLLYDAAGPRLAPLYDLLSTLAWPEVHSRMAMPIGRRAAFEEVDASAWERFAAATGLGAPFVRRRVGEVCERTRARARDVADALAGSPADPDGAETERLARAVAERADRRALAAGAGTRRRRDPAG